LIPAPVQTHLDGEVTSLANCWRIVRRDGVVVRLTDHDTDITVSGDGTYVADTGFERSAVEVEEGLKADTAEIEGFISDTGVDEEGIRRGMYEGAAMRIFTVNWQAPDDGQIELRAGRLGEVIIGESNRFRAEFRSLADLLDQNAGEVFSATCRADLGDSRCKIPIEPAVLGRDQAVTLGQFFRVVVAPGTTSEVYGNLIYEVTTAGTTASSAPTYDTTEGNPTSDGSAVLTARPAWTRHGSIDTVTDGANFVLNVTEPRNVDDWFRNGMITFESGPNEGLSRGIKSSLADGTIVLHLPFPDPPGIGNAFRIHAGCDKLATTCRDKFVMSGTQDFSNGNKINFRGEDYLPGRDAVFTYPDSQ